MRATITSTSKIVEISDPAGRRASARVWEGVTEGGVPFTAYITQTQVRNGGEAEFERDLVRSPAPKEETMKAIDMRYLV